MTLARIFPWFGRNRIDARRIDGIAVLGGNSGIMIQNFGGGAPPLPLTVPWAEALPASGAPFEIFNLLSWKSRLAPDLTGRGDEMSELRDWVQTGPKLRIRFLTGPGGAGKTRLAAELARSLPGWNAGFAALDQATPLPLSQPGLLAILDYPEAWREQVRALLREAARIEPPAPIRLLLLSRRPIAEWHEEIIACGASARCDAREIGVGPLDGASAAALFRTVAQRLAFHRKRNPPEIDAEALGHWLALRPDLHTLLLIATAAAVHFVDAPADTFDLTAADIVGALVERETMQLDLAGRNAGWGPKGASRLVGLAALREKLDAAAIERLAAPALQVGFPATVHPLDAAKTLAWWRAGGLVAPTPDIVASEFCVRLFSAMVAGPGNGPGRRWPSPARCRSN